MSLEELLSLSEQMRLFVHVNKQAKSQYMRTSWASQGGLGLTNLKRLTMFWSNLWFRTSGVTLLSRVASKKVATVNDLILDIKNIDKTNIE